MAISESTKQESGQEALSLEEMLNKMNSTSMVERERELQRLYGKRWDIYRERFQTARQFKEAFKFPIYIMLEQTYRCNLACPTCVQGHKDFRGEYNFKGVMPWDLYERVILEGEEHDLPSVSTHNNDEPLLVKDIAKRIKFARDHGVMDVIMTTNGLLFTEDKVKDVIDSGVTRMLFSIDAHTSETYDIVRPRRAKRDTEGLEKVKWSIDQALNYREKSGLKLPIIRVAFCVSHVNEHEIYDFIQEWKGVVDYIDIQPLLLGGVHKHKSGLIPSDFGKKVDDFRCNSPWGRMVIRGNGDVIACENFMGADTLTGNVYKNSIYEIYNSKICSGIRVDGRDGDYKHKGCVECASNVYVAEAEKYLKEPQEYKRTAWGRINAVNL